MTTFANEAGTGDSAYVWWAGKGTASGSSGNQEWGCRMYGLDNTQGRYNRTSGYCFNPSGGLGVGAYFQVPAAGPVAVGVFVHYVLVINTQNTSSAYPQGYVTIYRDGVNTNKQSLSGEGGITPVYGPPGVTPAPVRIGTRNFESYFEGAAGKFALYDYELTAAQVSTHYNAMLSFPGSLYTVTNGSTAAAAVTAGFPSNANWSYTTAGGWSYSGTPVLSSLDIGTQGVTVTQNGTTIQGCQVNGQVTVASGGSVAGTTITNSIIQQSAGGTGTGVLLGDSPSHVASNTTITGCTINGTDATTNRLATGIWDEYNTATGLVIEGCELYWCATALNVASATVAGNYIHDPGYLSGDTTNCVLAQGPFTPASQAAGLQVISNTLLNSHLSSAGAITLQSDAQIVKYVTITGNLLAGGQYSIYGGIGGISNHDGVAVVTSGTYATVTDTSAAAGDLGAFITNSSYLPADTTITAVSAGTGYTLSALSSACTAASGVTLTVHYTYHIQVTGNRFSQAYAAASGASGEVSSWDSAIGSNVWTGNVIHDTGANVPS